MTEQIATRQKPKEILEWDSETGDNLKDHRKVQYTREDYYEGQPDVFNEFNIAMVDYNIDHRNVVNNIYDLTQEDGDRREQKRVKVERNGGIFANTMLVMLSVALTYSAIVITLWLMSSTYQWLSLLLGIR